MVTEKKSEMMVSFQSTFPGCSTESFNTLTANDSLMGFTHCYHFSEVLIFSASPQKDKQLLMQEDLPSHSPAGQPLRSRLDLVACKPRRVTTNEQTRRCQETSWQRREWCWEYNEKNYYSQSTPSQCSKWGKLSHLRRSLF